MALSTPGSPKRHFLRHRSVQKTNDLKRFFTLAMIVGIFALLFINVAFIRNAKKIGESQATGLPGDCDGDNVVDIFDFQTLSNNFGRTGSTPTPGQGQTFTAIEDSYVSSQNITANYGSSTNAITLDYDSNLRTAYLKFNVGNVVTIQSAELRLTASLSRAIKKRIYTSGSNWNESTLNFTNRPSVGSQIGNLNRLSNTVSVWEVLTIPLVVENLTPDTNGNVTIIVDNAGSNNTFAFHTKESINYPPQLVIN